MQKRAIILLDDYCTTLKVFEDDAIWAWIEQGVTFPSGASSVNMPFPPGYDKDEDGEDLTTWEVTIGSPQDDLLHGAHHALPLSTNVEFEEPDDDNDNDAWEEQARAKARELGVADENIRVGWWY